MLKPKIYIAGHKGMVGSAIFRNLQKQNAILITKSHEELDLLDQKNVLNFFKGQEINQVYLAAAKVGGIHANNQFPAEFIYQNLMIQSNIINSAYNAGVKKLLFLGSSCIYPKSIPQPMKENCLLTGKLEPTNEPYAIAKIAGIKMCESYNRQYGVDYRSIMPTNLYGPGDNYDPENSHVIPGLIYRFHEAKTKNLPIVKIWGTGNPKREFLFVEDMAQACIHIMNLDKKSYNSCTEQMCNHINVGSGEEVSIKELAEIIQDIVEFKGKISFDESKPDGTQRKLLDCSKINSTGWKPNTKLIDGIKITYDKFKL